jgi:hypothetical protein
MAQDLLVKDREPVEEWEWGVALAEGGWVEISLGQDPLVIVFAPVAEQRFLIKQERLAII